MMSSSLPSRTRRTKQWARCGCRRRNWKTESPKSCLPFSKPTPKSSMGWTSPENGPKLRVDSSPRRNNLPCVCRRMCSQELRELLASVLWRIICQENTIEIKIRSISLRQHLESGGKITSASVPVKKPVVPSDLIKDIVEAILAGRQPHDLNFEKLCHDIPLSWVEQSEQLGFSPARTHGPRPSLGQ